MALESDTYNLRGVMPNSYLLNESGIVGSRTETGGRDETATPEHG
jgi:hypothetical protein